MEWKKHFFSRSLIHRFAFELKIHFHGTISGREDWWKELQHQITSVYHCSLSSGSMSCVKLFCMMIFLFISEFIILKLLGAHCMRESEEKKLNNGCEQNISINGIAVSSFCFFSSPIFKLLKWGEKCWQ